LILIAIKSGENFTHQELLEMIDIKTDKLKKELIGAKTRTYTDRIYDSIQSLEWLRYLLTSTNRGALGNLDIYKDL
jgi:thiaminase